MFCDVPTLVVSCIQVQAVHRQFVYDYKCSHHRASAHVYLHWTLGNVYLQWTHGNVYCNGHMAMCIGTGHMAMETSINWFLDFDVPSAAQGHPMQQVVDTE